MMAPLSLPVRRFAALGIFLAALFLLKEIAINPALNYWKETNGNNASIRLLQKNQKSVRDQPHWASLLQQMQTGQYADLFISADNPDLGAAKLQQDLKHLTETNGGSIKSIQALPPDQQHDPQYVSVRINFTVPVERLADILAKYAQARPYIFLDNLAVIAPDGSSDTKPLQLMVKCDFSSFMRPVAP